MVDELDGVGEVFCLRLSSPTKGSHEPATDVVGGLAGALSL